MRVSYRCRFLFSEICCEFNGFSNGTAVPTLPASPSLLLGIPGLTSSCTKTFSSQLTDTLDVHSLELTSQVQFYYQLQPEKSEVDQAWVPMSTTYSQDRQQVSWQCLICHSYFYLRGLMSTCKSPQHQ